jgi:hypothetical protein
MASDDDVAAALGEFAQELGRHSRKKVRAPTPLQNRAQQQRLKALSEIARTMAGSPCTATYQAFDIIWNEAQRLGVELDREITISVASAFVQRPRFRPPPGR